MSKTNIEILLGEWGAWKRGENRSALGYPDRTSTERIYVDGAQQKTPEVPLVDDDMRRIDRMIHQLHADHRIVVVSHYVALGPVKVKADRLKISKRIYYTTLEHAHKILSQQMGGIYLTGFEPKLCAHVELACAQM